MGEIGRRAAYGLAHHAPAEQQFRPHDGSAAAPPGACAVVALLGTGPTDYRAGHSLHQTDRLVVDAGRRAQQVVETRCKRAQVTHGRDERRALLQWNYPTQAPKRSTPVSCRTCILVRRELDGTTSKSTVRAASSVMVRREDAPARELQTLYVSRADLSLSCSGGHACRARALQSSAESSLCARQRCRISNILSVGLDAPAARHCPPLRALDSERQQRASEPDLHAERVATGAPGCPQAAPLGLQQSDKLHSHPMRFEHIRSRDYFVEVFRSLCESRAAGRALSPTRGGVAGVVRRGPLILLYTQACPALPRH
jgi:hypothetical protein